MADRRCMIVTGGDGKGIGSEVAAEAAKADWAVIGCGLDAAGGEGNFAQIRTAGGVGSFLPADLRIKSERERVVRAALEQFGRIDALVNNAGLALSIDRDIDDTDETAVVEAFNNNAVTAYGMSKAVLPHMLGRGDGAIVFVSSVNAVAGQYGQVGYAMAKASLGPLVRQGTAVFFGRGVRFNSVLVGTCPNNKMSWQKRRREMPTLVPALSAFTPRGRLTSPAEVAGVVLFLASDASRCISGAELPVDAGVLAAGGPFRGGDWWTEACRLYEGQIPGEVAAEAELLST